MGTTGTKLYRPGVSIQTQDFLRSGDLTLTEDNISKVRETVQTSQSASSRDIYTDVSEFTEYISGIEVNIMQPCLRKPSGAFVFIHGGGWILADWPAHRRMFHDLVIASGCTGIHINYTLSPEATHDTALQQCVTVCKTLHETKHSIVHLKQTSLCLVGNSVGGNMTIGTCMKMLEMDIPVMLQCLLWPVTDRNFHTTSYRRFRNGYFLTRSTMKTMWRVHTAGKSKQIKNEKQYLMPLQYAEDSMLQSFPETLVCVSENDVLRDEALMFAKRLDMNNVHVSTLSFPLTIHDWGLFDSLSSTADAQTVLELTGTKIMNAIKRSSLKM